MTTLTVPRRLMRPVASAPARRSLLVGLLAGLAAGLLLLVAVSLGVGIANDGLVMPGVRAGGVDLAGLDSAGVEARLAAELPPISTGSATVAVAEIRETVSYADLGRAYELDTMAAAALGVARDGDPLSDGIGRLRALFHPTSLPVTVGGHDDAAVNSLAASIAERAEIAPVESSVVRNGGHFDVMPSSPGRSVDSAEVASRIAAVLTSSDPGDTLIEIEPTTVAANVTATEALHAARAAERTALTLTLEIPGAAEDEELDSALKLDSDEIAAWISFGATADEEYGVTIDHDAVAGALEPLAEVIAQDAENAGFEVAAGGGLGGVIPARDGRTLRVDESTDALIATLEGRASGTPRASLVLDVEVDEPDLTTAEAEEALPRMEMVSTWTTNYVPGISNGFGANISIPAGDIDGTTVAPGDSFSFWGGLGPINTARGYTYGGAIINGRTEPTGALAGGICSTSTTLFNAAMRVGLEIGDRENHSYYIDRYPVGLDATVIKGDGFEQDMTFRNDTEHPLVIRGFGVPGRVTFQIWSVPNDRRVVLSEPSVTDRRSAVDTTRVDPSLGPGEARRIEFPHDGMNVTVSRTVYDGDGDVLHEDKWFSDYRTINGIVLVGEGAPAEPAAVDPGTGGGGTTDDDDESPEPTPEP